jgi:hypothetical protein
VDLLVKKYQANLYNASVRGLRPMFPILKNAPCTILYLKQCVLGCRIYVYAFCVMCEWTRVCVAASGDYRMARPDTNKSHGRLPNRNPRVVRRRLFEKHSKRACAHTHSFTRTRRKINWTKTKMFDAGSSERIAMNHSSALCLVGDFQNLRTSFACASAFTGNLILQILY